MAFQIKAAGQLEPQAVQRTVETARRLGIDLYREPAVEAMHAVALDYLMADGTLCSPSTVDSL